MLPIVFFYDIILSMERKKFKLRLSPSLQVLLGFMGLILLGTFLLALPISNRNGEWLNFIDALFSSTTSVCVTGLVVVDVGFQFTLFGQFVIMFLIQMGGLGIVALTSLIFLLLRKKINFSSRVAIKESLNRESMQGIVKFIKRVIILTFTIEAIGALCMLYSTITFTGSFWRGLFAACFMAISSFCNAGIDVFGSETSQFMSLNPFASDVLMQISVMMLIIIGGIGFAVIIDGFKNFKNNQHAKVVVFTTITLIFGGATLYMICEWNNPLTIGNMSVGEEIINSFFQSVTTRTGGASTFDQAGLTMPGTILTMFLMFVGGSPTSTAGGIKTTTLFILLLLLIKAPNDNGNLVFKNRRISVNILLKAVKIVLYSTIVLIIGVTIISVVEGDNFSFIEVVFECISALSTVGLTMGITPYLSPISKLVVLSIMFIGRVGMMTIILALSARASNINNQIEYINTDIIVG